MNKKTLQLSDHFTYGKLLRFTIPSVLMMLFTSIYGVVDGLFVSNVVGKTAFASINLVMPYCYIFSAVGSLFGVGGSALVALEMGKGNKEKAIRIFSMLVYGMIICGAVIAVGAQLFLPTALKLLGATETMAPLSLRYARIFLMAMPAYLLQFGFQSFLITAERPKLGLFFTVGAGVTNMVLDFVFIAVLGWGVAGAAAATVIGQCVGGLGPLIYFIFARQCPLHLTKTTWMPWAFAKSASNGTADCIINVAMSFVNMVFNRQLMRYIGEYGVASYGIIMYVNFVFIAVFLGYSMGSAPIFSYHYGAGHTDEMQSLFKKSLRIVVTASVILSLIAITFAPKIAAIFAGYDPEFLRTATHALRFYVLCNLLAGTNLFGINLFAALNNGPVSGMLSGLRMLVFQLLFVWILPMIIGSDGIWLAPIAAEVCLFIVVLIVLRRERERYHYY